MNSIKSEYSTEKIEELSLLIQSNLDEQVFKNLDKNSYPLNHSWSDGRTFIHKAVIWKNAVALKYLLECMQEGFIQHEMLEHNKDYLYYDCINKATGKMDRDIAGILMEYLPLKSAWEVTNIFDALVVNDIASIGFLIKRGLSLFPDVEYNKNQGLKKDVCAYRGLISNISTKIDILDYLESHNFCKWNDSVLTEPLLYYVIKGSNFFEMKADSQEANDLKEKMVYLINHGCRFDAPLIADDRAKKVDELFLNMIEDDIDYYDEEASKFFKDMFSELKISYETSKLKKMLNINNEDPVKIKRL